MGAGGKSSADAQRDGIGRERYHSFASSPLLSPPSLLRLLGPSPPLIRSACPGPGAAPACIRSRIRAARPCPATAPAGTRCVTEQPERFQHGHGRAVPLHDPRRRIRSSTRTRKGTSLAASYLIHYRASGPARQRPCKPHPSAYPCKRRRPRRVPGTAVSSVEGKSAALCDASMDRESAAGPTHRSPARCS